MTDRQAMTIEDLERIDLEHELARLKPIADLIEAGAVLVPIRVANLVWTTDDLPSDAISGAWVGKLRYVVSSYPENRLNVRLVTPTGDLMDWVGPTEGIDLGDAHALAQKHHADRVTSCLVDTSRSLAPPVDHAVFPAVDYWVASDWFERLKMAIESQDRAVVAGDTLQAETFRMVAASSAMRLVRDHGDYVTRHLRGTMDAEHQIYLEHANRALEAEQEISRDLTRRLAEANARIQADAEARHAMQDRAERIDDILIGLSSYLGVGLPETVDVDDIDRRLRDGIEILLKPIEVDARRYRRLRSIGVVPTTLPGEDGETLAGDPLDRWIDLHLDGQEPPVPKRMTTASSIELRKRIFTILSDNHLATTGMKSVLVEGEVTRTIDALAQATGQMSVVNDKLRSEVIYLRNVPWPAWATEILAAVRSRTGHDGPDGPVKHLDIVAEVEACLRDLEMASDETNARIAAELDLERHREAAERYRLIASRLRLDIDTWFSDTSRLPDAAPDYWKAAIGEPYRFSTMTKHRAAHPITVGHVLRIAMQRAPECADTIVALVFWKCLANEREGMAWKAVQEERDQTERERLLRYRAPAVTFDRLLDAVRNRVGNETNPEALSTFVRMERWLSTDGKAIAHDVSMAMPTDEEPAGPDPARIERLETIAFNLTCIDMDRMTEHDQLLLDEAVEIANSLRSEPDGQATAA